MKQLGFTLIELLIALFISSLLATILFRTYNISTAVVIRANDIIRQDMDTAILYNVLSRDISGAFLPYNDEETQRKPKKDEQAKKDAANKQPKKDDATKETEDTKKKKKPQPIKDVFVATKKGDNTTMMTFITSNPIAIYEQAKNSKPKQRMVRVMYRLEKDADHKNAFRLMRQEASNLDRAAFDPEASHTIRSYEVIDMIKRFEVSFEYPKVSEQEAPKEDSKEQPPFVYKKVNSWPVSSQEGAPQIPATATIELTLWNNELFRSSTTYTFKFDIDAFIASLVPRKKPQPKKPPAKAKSGKKQSVMQMKPMDFISNLNQMAHQMLAEFENKPKTS